MFLYLRQVAINPVSIAEAIRSITTPPGWDTGPLQGYPPAFHQASLTIHQCPFIPLG